jgi:hypothetical protein
VLDDVVADAVGVRGLRADMREAGTAKHLRGTDVVRGDTSEERSCQLDPEERFEGLGGDAPTHRDGSIQ